MKLSKIIIVSVLILGTLNACTNSIESDSVLMSGSLKQSIWKRELKATISLDTVSMSNLYGFGPSEGLNGDYLVVDGEIYESKDINSEIVVKNVKECKSPYFVYQYIPKWSNFPIKDHVDNIEELETLILSEKGLKRNKESGFKLEGKFKAIEISVHNLPDNLKFYNYQVALTGNLKKQLTDEEGVIIGFFESDKSMKYTHHNDRVTMYFISKDKKRMGRISQFYINPKEVKFYLPKY